MYIQKRTVPVNRLINLIMLPVSIALAVYFLWIYAHYKGAGCANRLPMWIGVMGVAFLIAVLINFAYTISYSMNRRKTYQQIDLQEEPSMGHICFECLSFMLYLFLFVWFIIGSIWTFTLHPTQCNSFVYNVSYYFLIAAWIVFALTTVGGCLFCLCGAALVASVLFFPQSNLI